MTTRGLFLILIALALSACTTIKPHDQRVKLATDPEGANVYLNDKLMGHTPGYIAIPRGKTATLRFEKKGYPTITRKLDTTYRWGDSFFSDFVWFIYGAPIAWGIDYLTDTIWDYDKIDVISFSGKKETQPLNPPRLIAISPPQSDSELLSNEAAQRIFGISRGRFSSSEVQDFDANHSLFAQYGWDNREKTQKYFLDDLFNELDVTHVLESRVTEDSKDVIIHSRLVDVFTDQEVETYVDKIPLTAFKYAKTGFWADILNYLISVCPNTISFDFATPGATMYASNNYSFQGAAETTASALSIINGIGIKSLDSPKFQKGISGVLKLIPIITLSYNRYNLSPAAGVNFTGNYNFDWGTILAGFGPEVGLVTTIGYFYTELAPAISMNWITASSTQQSTSARGTAFALIGEIGYSMFASSRINLRLFTRIQTSPIDPWSQVLTQIGGTPITVQSVTQTTAGLSIGYYFPEDRIILKRAFFPY
jgi:hypothetical protein